MHVSRASCRSRFVEAESCLTGRPKGVSIAPLKAGRRTGRPGKVLHPHHRKWVGTE